MKWYTIKAYTKTEMWSIEGDIHADVWTFLDVIVEILQTAGKTLEYRKIIFLCDVGTFTGYCCAKICGIVECSTL